MSAFLFSSIRGDFNARMDEVNNYFRFISDLADGKLNLIPDMTQGGTALSTLERDLLVKTLKANLFLLLYNLVESTTKNSIQAIYDSLRAEGISYDQCRREIKLIALKNIKKEKIKIDTLYNCLNSIAQHILTETFDQKTLLPGSIDAKSLRELADDYGFSHVSGLGNKLKDVKDNRNSLAHGNKTFNEVGKDFGPSDLLLIKDQVESHLSSFVDNVEDYVNNKMYLAPPTSSATAPTTT